MTTVVEILDRAARQCSVASPESWITATDPTALEFKDFLDETREDIQSRCDWIGPISKMVTIDSTTWDDDTLWDDLEDWLEMYALPADFLRLHRDPYAVYERAQNRRPCIPVTRDGDWEYIKDLGIVGAYRLYRLQGYDGNWTVSFNRPIEEGGVIVVNYVSKFWLINSGTTKEDFTAAEDVCLLPRRLIEAGIVWRFRRRKALPYQDVLAEYEILMARTATDNRMRQTINFGGGRSPRSPWDIPIPDVIPST